MAATDCIPRKIASKDELIGPEMVNSALSTIGV